MSAVVSAAMVVFLAPQGQAAGLLERCVLQLRQTVERRALARANDGIAQDNILGCAVKVQVNAAGLILNVDVLPVHQRHNALDGELRVSFSRKGGTDGNGRRLGVGSGIRVLATIVHHQVELLLKGSPCAFVSAPMQEAFSGIPLQAVFIGADCIVDVVCGILAIPPP